MTKQEMERFDKLEEALISLSQQKKGGWLKEYSYLITPFITGLVLLVAFVGDWSTAQAEIKSIKGDNIEIAANVAENASMIQELKECNVRTVTMLENISDKIQEVKSEVKTVRAGQIKIIKHINKFH